MIAVNDFGEEKSPRCKRVLVLTELVVSGTLCIQGTHTSVSWPFELIITCSMMLRITS